MRARTWLAAVVVLALVSCQGGHPARANGIEAALGQPFTLAGGQQATIIGAPLRLRFTQVLEDSRCPTEVECVWTGQARVAVEVERGQGRPTTVEFNTNPAPGQNRQAVRSDGYLIALQALDPYPRTPDDVATLEDYRATLLVSRPN
ncbi:hypothetical protein ABGB19_09510 [Mycobacterium sp. B14F4]|uniref:hypothetical protein n=1 Tax=Mycobacterium sp. B14F4 TaxID=3153565 RepID=UPI00325F2D6C